MVNMDDALITLTSSDKQDIQISVKAATGSKFIVDALCLEDEEGIANELLLEVAKVDYSTLKTIVDFLNEYSAHPFASIDYESLRATGFEEVFSHPYYKKFMEDLEEGEGFSDSFYLIKGGANYMNVTPLLEMICVYLVYKCEKAPNGAAIRSLLKIPTTDPAELKELRKQNPWMFTREDDDVPTEPKVETEATVETETAVETEAMVETET